MIKIVSDGINHKVLNSDGTELHGVMSITIDEILPGSAVTATLVFTNVQLDLASDNVMQEYFKINLSKD